MGSQKMTNCLWFDGKAEEAANFYTSIFKDSSIGRKGYYTEEGQEIHGNEPGSLMTIEFRLNNMHFLGLNGGPQFKFNEAISIMVYCDTQDEIDYYWERLNEGGDPSAQQCGWLKDKFGVSWQITPPQLDDMLLDENKEKANRAMRAMMSMKKLDLAELEKAYNGE
jgi:predicted 3-demethylubiquinone-9 3-methyltransferase (glyoxalase superfamily)